ncbi:MAG: DegT/DnrJ/EryC1/StrS family aminotransferase [Gemmatimonadota bacterium]
MRPPPTPSLVGPDVEGARGMRVPLARPWMGPEEAEAAREVVASRWLIQGAAVAEFEARFAALIGAEHAIAVNSGSSALLVAMGALGVGAGDEVVCPDMTFVSTASAALFLGARPVLADIEMRTYGLDPSDLERCIGPRTRAIVPVHYAGHSAEMGPILEIAERHGIPVLEDAAESHLARYQGGRCTGTLGRIGIFSFTPSKPMTTGEGGMIVTDDAALAERCRRFRNFGDTGKFEWTELGFNFRMPEMMGAIGLVQLERLPEAVRRRRQIAGRYSHAFHVLPDVVVPHERQAEDANYQLYTLRVEGASGSRHRDTVRASLSERGVGNRLYYPPLHGQGVFAHLAEDAGHFPNATRFAETALSLPIFPELTEDEQSFVIDAFIDSIRGLKSP